MLLSALLLTLPAALGWSLSASRVRSPLSASRSKLPRSPGATMQTARDTGGAAIVIEDVDVWAGSSPLILGVNWNVMPNDRWALLGTNGCGKSTLLREIADSCKGEKTSGDDGVIKVLSSLRMGMLEQTAVSGSETTVKEEVMSRMEDYQQARAELDAAEDGCLAGEQAELDCLEAAQAKFEAIGGYQVEARVSRVLQGLGFEPAEFDSRCSSFSGGWQMRIGLARLLLSEPELLIMDEPTNHLDASARRWLGDYVGGYKGTVLVVSHDEEFVGRASNSIAEVAGGRLELYKSKTYEQYLVERKERQARVRATVEAQERERKRMQGFIDKMGAKASKATQAKDRQNKLDRLAKLQEASQALLISEQKKPALTLAKPPACGMAPLALRGADIRHPLGSVDIISGAELEVTKGMRLLLRGPNGAGKSTVLKALAGQLSLGVGQRFADERLELGVFAQDLAQELPQEVGALVYVASKVRQADPSLTEEQCRAVMGTLGLVGEKATRPIGQLSGGEKARVALATFCLTPCNVLLLDEPTNHLDVEAIAALLEAIGKYEGSIVVVSHDRAFSEGIASTHVGYVANGVIDIQERSLRESDWNELDRGVVNVGVADEPQVAAPADASTELPEAVEEPVKKAVRKAPTEEERAAQRIIEQERAAQLRDLIKRQAEEPNRVTTLPPPAAPPAPPPAPTGPSQRELNRLKEQLAQPKKKEKKLKFGKRERAEYAAIEAEIDALETAAAKANAEEEEAKSGNKRLGQMELLAIVSAASQARSMLDQKLERYMELEDLMAQD